MSIVNKYFRISVRGNIKYQVDQRRLIKNWDVMGILEKRFSRKILNIDVGRDWFFLLFIYVKYNGRFMYYLVREVYKIYIEDYILLNEDNRRGIKECIVD